MPQRIVSLLLLLVLTFMFYLVTNDADGAGYKNTGWVRHTVTGNTATVLLTDRSQRKEWMVLTTAGNMLRLQEHPSTTLTTANKHNAAPCGNASTPCNRVDTGGDGGEVYTGPVQAMGESTAATIFVWTKEIYP